MARLMDLVVGSVVKVGGIDGAGVLIARTTPHPQFKNMTLAVWYITGHMYSEGFRIYGGGAVRFGGGGAPHLSFDALDMRADVGDVIDVWSGDELFNVVYKIGWSPSVPGSGI